MIADLIDAARSLTPALAVLAATVALSLGSLVVIAALCLIRGWQENRP